MSSHANQAVSPDLRLTLFGPGVPTDLSPDQQAIVRQIERWQRLFSPGEMKYSLSGYESLFSNEKDVLLVYDNFSPSSTRFTGFDEYREIWEQEINDKFPGLLLYHIEIDRILVNGDLAASAFTWWGSVFIDDELSHTSQHATHVWHKNGGQWQIIHEHLTGPAIEDGKESRR